MALGVERILWFLVLLVASLGSILLLFVYGEILRMRSEIRMLATAIQEKPTADPVPGLQVAEVSAPISVARVARLPAGFKEIPNSGHRLDCYTSLLKIPVSVAVQSSQNLYQLTFSSEATRHLKDGSWVLMKRSEGSIASIATEHGRIQEVGTITQQQTWTVRACAALVWQALSIVTLQHYLSRIDKQLGGILQIVQDLMRHLEADEAARVDHASRYIGSTLAALDSAGFSALEMIAVLAELERLDNECAVIARRREILLSKPQSTAPDCVATGWVAGLKRFSTRVGESIGNVADKFKIENYAEEVQGDLDRFERTSQAFASALYTRLMIANLRLRLPVNQQRTKHTLAAILKAAKKHEAIRSELLGRIEDEEQILSKKLDWSGAREGAVETVAAKRNLISENLGRSFGQIAHVAREIEQDLNRMLKQSGRELTLHVAADASGNVTAVYYPDCA